MSIKNLCTITCWFFAVISMITGGNWEAFIAASFVLVGLKGQ